MNAPLPSATTPGIAAEGVSFSFGNRPIFENLSFRVPDGAVYGLVGKSGIGKTTLLNLVLGIYRPRAGRILLHGRPVNEPGEIRGVVFREESLLGWRTVEENILFPSTARRSPTAAADARAALFDAGLGAEGQMLPKSLSAGMAKRVELLRAWAADVNYFVADEPFSSLDIHTREAVYGMWGRLRAQRPRTGLLCTHDPIEAERLCDAVLVMHSDVRGVRITELACGSKPMEQPAASSASLAPRILDLMQ